MTKVSLRHVSFEAARKSLQIMLCCTQLSTQGKDENLLPGIGTGAGSFPLHISYDRTPDHRAVANARYSPSIKGSLSRKTLVSFDSRNMIRCPCPVPQKSSVANYGAGGPFPFYEPRSDLKHRRATGQSVQMDREIFRRVNEKSSKFVRDGEPEPTAVAFLSGRSPGPDPILLPRCL